MRAENGRRVTISFVCRLENGALYNFTNATMLTFTVGRGHTLPTLDDGVVGMKPGEHRTLRLQAKELEEHPLVAASVSAAEGVPAGSSRAPNGYEFAPGSDGEAIMPSQPHHQLPRPPLSPGTVVLFHVKMIKVEDPHPQHERGGHGENCHL